MAKANLEKTVKINLELSESEAQDLYNLLNLGVEFDSLKKNGLYDIFTALDDMSELEESFDNNVLFKTKAELR